MAKKTEVVDLYIRVDAQELNYRRRDADHIKYLRGDLESMASDIKRHVDNVQRVDILEETESTCEFCGSRWTEDSDAYNGGCCKEDLKSDPADTA